MGKKVNYNEKRKIFYSFFYKIWRNTENNYKGEALIGKETQQHAQA